MDDNYGWEDEGNELFYSPYRRWMPRKQAILLTLWDELGIPHEPQKQLSGANLTIIGFDVDPNNLTVTMPTESKNKLIEHITDFISTKSRKRPLQEWSQLAGYICWSLNVYPLLRPCLSHIYMKLSDKSLRAANIYINNAVREDLNWFIKHVRTSSGILVYHAVDWKPIHDCDLEIRCDACLDGMGFWCVDSLEGFYANIPFQTDEPNIILWEAICVLMALYWAAKNRPKQLFVDRKIRILLLTDNEPTVHMFDSLAAQPFYNDILKQAVDIMLSTDVDVRVLHIPGEENEVADALSRKNFALARSLQPGLSITTILPPRVVLGASKK